MLINKLSFADFYTIVWSMVPQVWKDADAEYGMPLQILLYTMSQHMYYYFYSKVVHMEELFDPDRCPEKYLKFLAGMIGWKLIGTDPDSWREQIKAAPLLYKIRGTNRGVLLAEKLIGYSVFMSELYRDHVGDAVPKERIFNNTPAYITQKPWFRNTLLSTEGELLGGQAESDQFDSFNATAFVKLDKFGKVIRPRLASNKRALTFKSSSTTSLYNNISGKNSVARYAKLPRINVVLKYEHDLGEELSDGSIKQNNFTGAIDLLLQFKPFHVYINNLEVRYSLSEFVFDQTNIGSETLNVHEDVLSAIHLNQARAENTITFSPNPAVEYTEALNESPAPANDNRGVISSVYKSIFLGDLTPILETSLYSVSKKALPIKAIDASIVAFGDSIINRDEFIAALPITTNTPVIGPYTEVAAPTIIVPPQQTTFYYGYESLGVQLTCTCVTSSTDTLTVNWYRDAVLIWTDTSDLNKTSTLNISPAYLDGSSHSYECVMTNSHGSDSASANVSGIEVPVHAILQYNTDGIIQEPILDFKSMLSSQHNVSISDTTTDITYQWTDETPPRYVTSADPYWAPGQFDKVAEYDKLISDNYIVGDPDPIISIASSSEPYRSSVQTIYDLQNITSTPSRPWDLSQFPIISSLSGMSELALFNHLYNNTTAIVLEITLEGDGPYTEYVLLERSIDYYLDNEDSIFLNSASIASKLGGFTDYKYLLTCTLHVAYLTRTTYKNESELGIQSRGFRLKTRVNTKFSRQFLINSLPQESLSRLMPTEIVSVDGKTKQKTVLGTKKFKESINVYTRSSLKNEVIDNYTVVSKDPLNRIDQSKWTVYSPEYSDLFLGDQKITNNWWGNYYQAKFPDASLNTPAFVSYDEIDRSTEAQLKNAYSNQWISALRYLNLSDPKHFLATRKFDSNRTGIWKRNSCKFVSIPFIRSRRDALQVFRRDTPTFTRSEESTDYLVDTGVPIRLDNYKYVLPDNTDVSLSYFTPGFSETARVNVTMDRALGEKAILTTSGYSLTFPGSDTYYNNYSSDSAPETYFGLNSANEYVIKSSIYAGNIPVSRDPSQFTGITDGLDKLDLIVTGLQVVKDTFTVVSTETSFTLSKTNLFVSWTEANTGEGVAFGYYPPYNLNAIPNIIVTINGIVSNYDTTWLMTFDKLKTLNVLTPLAANDVVTVEYQTMPGDDLSAIPQPQIPHVIDIVLSSQDVSLIREGNRYIFDLPNTLYVPCVSWYSSVTSEFINYGSTPIQYQPMALYEEATPNTLLSINGLATRYKIDWQFLLKQELGETIAAVAISPKLSLTLSAGDSIKFEYFSTT